MINREIYLDFLIKLKDKQIIKVVTGVIGCGKSTLLELYREYLLNNNVSKEQIISINFENSNNINFTDWKDLYNSIEKNY